MNSLLSQAHRIVLSAQAFDELEQKMFPVDRWVIGELEQGNLLVFSNNKCPILYLREISRQPSNSPPDSEQKP